MQIASVQANPLSACHHKAKPRDSVLFPVEGFTVSTTGSNAATRADPRGKRAARNDNS